MSIVERASNLFDKQAKVSPPAPVEDASIGKFDTAAVDIIESNIERENAKSDIQVVGNSAAASATASSQGARDYNALAQGPVSQRVTPTLIIDPDRLRQQNMTTPDGERTAVSESFRRIKRHILANVSNPDAPPGSNLVMITSSMPKEGKTFCTVNLAISLAMEMDRRVLLVDADVLRPSVLNALGIRSVEKGLMDVLLDGLSLADVLCNTNIEKLSLLSSGRKHAHASELLASDAMRNMLSEMAERYRDRIIIFDSPPLLATTESSVLASLMGQVLVVVEAGQTTEGTLRDALGRIQSNNVVGVLLNKGGAPGSSLYGGYGYGYGYGEGEGDDGRKK